MKLKLKIASSLCCTNVFEINGIQAHQIDFGEAYDRSPETAEDYSCGNMQFTRIPPTSKVLKKYKITADEYAAVAQRLEEGLSFGACGWCS